ncbi:MAG: T9SS type A sorting domain-containing protein [Crocinitomicaceae bacterium]|nr:T9SS type A sorting domain-containing protein [Crocinitomicaceae bacterium]
MELKILALIFLISFKGFTQTPELIFHSGFEPLSTETITGEDIIGIDNSVSPPNDWVNDLENHPNIGDFSIYYEGGNDTMRFARIVQDPTDPTNQILHYWLKYPYVGGLKGRIQADMYWNNDLTELSQKVRLYLPSDWNIIKNAAGGTVTWLTIMEFMNNAGWTGEDHKFRIHIGIHKNDPFSSELNFNLGSDTKPGLTWLPYWDYVDTAFSIPVDQWMTLEFYFKEGDASNGRFSLAVTPDGGVKQTIFDVTNFTHHPSDPSPDGLTHYNPMKLYTSNNVIDYVRLNGGVLQVYWDDFEIWKDTNITLNVPENKTLDAFKLYPNPMKDYSILTFNNSTNESHTLELYNTFGQLVQTITDIKSGQVVISKEHLTTGVYFFQLSTERRKRLTGKLMIY